MNIIGVLLLLFIHPASPDQALKGREHLSLNGPWQWADETADGGVKAGWFKEPPAKTDTISVPNPVSHKRTGAVWYWRFVTVPETWRKKSIRLRLSGFSGTAEVWIAAQEMEAGVRSRWLVGREGLEAHALTFDVTKAAAIGTSFPIAIRVAEHGPQPIPGDIELLGADEAFIQDVQVQKSSPGWLNVRVVLFNQSDKSGDAEIEVAVFEREKTKNKVSRAIQRVVVSPGLNRADLMIKIRLPKLDPGVELPSFIAEAQFRQGKDLLDNETIPLPYPN